MVVDTQTLPRIIAKSRSYWDKTSYKKNVGWFRECTTAPVLSCYLYIITFMLAHFGNLYGTMPYNLQGTCRLSLKFSPVQVEEDGRPLHAKAFLGAFLMEVGRIQVKNHWYNDYHWREEVVWSLHLRKLRWIPKTTIYLIYTTFWKPSLLTSILNLGGIHSNCQRCLSCLKFRANRRL